MDVEASLPIPVYEKTSAEIEEITSLLNKIIFTKNLDKDDVAKIAGAMRPQQFSKGDCIIKYGDPGHTYYILIKGSVQVTVYKPGTKPDDKDRGSKIAFTKEMNQGIGFGEMALLYNEPRSATIEANEECDTYVIGGTLFKQIIVSTSRAKRDLLVQFLDNIKLLGKYFHTTN